MFDVFKDKKVLVTGHTGFKGSWLSIWLLKSGADVVGYALDPKSEKDNFVLSNLESEVKDYREDIRDFDKLSKIIKRENPEIIFHLAAQPLVLDSYENPHYTIETNTQGIANILEVFRKSSSAKVLIVITTDKVYQNNEWEWGYREIDRLGGNDPYSASKAAAELIISSYQRSFFQKSEKKLVSVRAGNVIGGGDWSKDRIVPDCVKALERGKKILIRNPQATRPWQHVLEPLSGYLKLGEKLLNGYKQLNGAWNFGPGYSNIVNVEKLVQTIILNYGKGAYTLNKSETSPKESRFLSLDISKAINKLHWHPVLNLNETIEMTIDWYKSYQTNDVYSMCKNQIDTYERLWKLKQKN